MAVTSCCLCGRLPRWLLASFQLTDAVGPVPVERLRLVRVVLRPTPLTGKGSGVSQRWMPVNAYLEPARHRPDLTITGNVYVARVIFEGQRAVAVETRGGVRQRYLPGHWVAE